MMGWLKRRLGIDYLESEVERLQNLEHFTLADVINSLKDSMLVLGNDNQTLQDIHIIVPPDKTGVMILGSHCFIKGGYVTPARTKITTEYPDNLISDG